MASQWTNWLFLAFCLCLGVISAYPTEYLHDPIYELDSISNYSPSHNTEEFDQLKAPSQLKDDHHVRLLYHLS